MRTLRTLFIHIVAVNISMFGTACTSTVEEPLRIKVDNNIMIAVYSIQETANSIDTVSPSLLEESIRMSELIRYPHEDNITVPFSFSDTEKWSEITQEHLNKRIAICIDGEIMNTPLVNMKLENGACSLFLNDTQALMLFPNVNIDRVHSMIK